MSNKKERRRRYLWQLIVLFALGLVVITFTPLVLSPGRIYPKFLSMPYTLWASGLITLILVILTYAGSRVRNND